MSDLCFTCQLPDCDDSHPGCALMAPKREVQARYSAVWRRRHRFDEAVKQIISDRTRRIERIARQIRSAA